MYYKSNYNDLEKLNNEHFINVLKQIIEKESECEFLDFKEKIHDNNAELLKDIISLANNVNENDGLLILGVEDNKQICGVNMPKFEEHIINVLESNRKKFASQSIPKIYVRNTVIEGYNVEIIIIKNSIKTPFYLVENYRCNNIVINPYEIYTRNLSNKRIAYDYEIEKLWSKRFGLNKTSLDKFLHLSNQGWKFINKNSNDYSDKYIYNINNPEYTIRFSEAKGINNYPYSKILNIFNGYEKNYKGTLQVFYHSVVIFEDVYYFMKDCEYTEKNQRYIPNFKEIKIIDMKYYFLDTIQGKLVRILNKGNLNFFSGRERIEYGHFFVFYHENDFENFYKYIINRFNLNTDEYDKFNDSNSFEMYIHCIFASAEFKNSYNKFAEEAISSNFTLLPENFKELLSEHKLYIDAHTFRPELLNILEKAYLFVLYLDWRNIDESEYNIFLENMS